MIEEVLRYDPPVHFRTRKALADITLAGQTIPGGAPVILVSYGYTPEPARTLGADAVVDDFRAVPEAVRRILEAG